jgi:hypothetical protein
MLKIDSVKNKITITGCSRGDVKEVKCVQCLAISMMGLALVVFVSACGTTRTSKETTTTYVPAPPAQVVVQAPVPLRRLQPLPPVPLALATERAIQRPPIRVQELKIRLAAIIASPRQ